MSVSNECLRNNVPSLGKWSKNKQKQKAFNCYLNQLIN